MSTEITKALYNTKAWKTCRNNYMKYRGGLCEKCLQAGLIVPAEIVHHKIHLNAENIKDTSITLNWDNLEALCRTCHGLEHNGKRYRVDEYGNVTAK